MFIQCLVSPVAKVEHVFISALLNDHGMKHGLLEDMPCPRDEDDRMHRLTEGEFLEARLPMIRSRRDLISSVNGLT
jgi:hypothetical protein